MGTSLMARCWAIHLRCVEGDSETCFISLAWHSLSLWGEAVSITQAVTAPLQGAWNKSKALLPACLLMRCDSPLLAAWPRWISLPLTPRGLFSVNRSQTVICLWVRTGNDQRWKTLGKLTLRVLLLCCASSRKKKKHLAPASWELSESPPGG